MKSTLSIKAHNQELNIDANKSDIAAALVRGIVGAAPLVGPLAVELITTTIPDQKLERIARSFRVLEDRLQYLEEDTLKQKFKTEEFADLLEDALPKMARALTDERKAYIANLLSISLTDDTLDHLAKKKLLNILDELNDAEIILLHFYALRQTDEVKANKMIEDYPFIRTALLPFDIVETTDKQIMFREYHGTLTMASLVEGPPQNEYPSALGYLLLRYIEPDKVGA